MMLKFKNSRGKSDLDGRRVASAIKEMSKLTPLVYDYRMKGKGSQAHRHDNLIKAVKKK